MIARDQKKTSRPSHRKNVYTDVTYKKETYKKKEKERKKRKRKRNFTFDQEKFPKSNKRNAYVERKSSENNLFLL